MLLAELTEELAIVVLKSLLTSCFYEVQVLSADFIGPIMPSHLIFSKLLKKLTPLCYDTGMYNIR